MDQQTITLIIAVIGCLGTILNWVIFFWNERANISIDVHEIITISNKCVILYLTFINNSKTSLSISNIAITNTHQKIFAKRQPIVIWTEENKTGGVVTDSSKTFNEPFPINLPALSGQSGYFYFGLTQHNPLTLDKYVFFEIYTNRKQKMLLRVELNEDCLQQNIS